MTAEHDLPVILQECLCSSKQARPLILAHNHAPHCLQVLRNLVTACQPEKLVDLLGAGMLHPNWRVREEVTNSLIMVRAQGLLVCTVS